MIKFLIVFGLTLLTILIVHTIADEDASQQQPIVQTKYGKVQGIQKFSREGRPYFEFWAIPYAKVPARFQPPIQPDSWTDVRNGTSHGTSCVQFHPKSKLNVKEGFVVGKEDCLEVNVFTPRVPAEAKHKLHLPVLVIFHSGGFSHGTGIFLGAPYFMDTDTVLVTFNSRVGPLGYLNTGDKNASGNQGLKDQVALLQWVKNNIEYFSGDSSRVTIMGFGSGASTVDYHLLSPMSKGLFHAAIKQSGSALAPCAFIRDPLKQAKELGVKLDCPIDTSVNLIKCLQGKDAKDLVSRNMWFIEPIFEDFHLSWGPSIEPEVEGQERFLTDNPHKLAAGEKFVNKVPAISGLNNLDGAVPFVVKLINNTEYLAKLNQDWNKLAPNFLMYRNTAKDPVAVSQKIRQLYFKDKEINHETRLGVARLVADRFFFQPGKKMAEYHSKFAPVFTYIVTYQGNFSTLELYGVKDKLGVVHGDEIQYEFPIEHFRIPVINSNSPDFEFSKKFVQLWASFVENGKPTKIWGEGKEWKKFDPLEKPWKMYRMDLNSTTYEVPEVLTKRIEFWNELYANDLKAEVETPEIEVF